MSRLQDDLWGRYIAELHKLGVVIDSSVDLCEFHVIHTLPGRYGSMPVRIEYHVGMVNWPGFVEVFDGTRVFIFMHVHSNYNGPITTHMHVLR